MDEIRCSMCFFSTKYFNHYRSHVVRIHKNDPNFIVHCCIDNCAYSTKKWSSYRSHISRKHQDILQQNNQQDNEDDDDDEIFENACIAEQNVDSLQMQTQNTAVHTLAFESKNDMPQQALDNFVETTRQLVQSNIQLVLDKLKERNIDVADVEPTMSEIDHSFEALNSAYKRNKFYTENLGYIAPEEVFLGSVRKTKNGRPIRCNKYGYIIPFRENVKSLLSLPEVWQFIQNTHTSNDDIVRDFCDADHFQRSPLFQRNPKALQVVIYTDDLEIVNPLGAHVKKHKITVFYFTLCNIPPEFRSKLHSMQLLAIAKTKDVKRFGPKNLLNDFIQTMNELSQGGIQMLLHGSYHNIEGSLVYIPADTPASNWLGGFKEGVSFSYKVCRTCNASNSDLKHSFCENEFKLRDYNLHKQRCDTLEGLDKNGRQHFSKVWGITGRSALCDIADFNLCVGLVHDPMHIFLEGILRLELQLVLFDLIFNQKRFTLAWLNHQLRIYSYSYSQVKNKPEPIERKQVLGTSPFRQTAAAMITLCEVLPHIAGPKILENDHKWLNFLRLVQITFLCISPVCDRNTVGMLSQLIITHHTEFVKLYPKSGVTPKMHYCIHLAMQMFIFGPLRHLWCMRFEGKHGFFKTKKWKCFKNLPKSMAKKHQLYMCHKQTMSDGTRNPNFLYEGDIVKEGVEKKFLELYPDLLESFKALTNENFGDGESPMVYVSEFVEICGHQYKVGCILFTEVENWIPQFAIIQSIIVFKDRKLFVVKKMSTECFVPKYLSYKISETGQLSIISQTNMKFKWPLWSQTVDGGEYVLNKYSYFSEFF